MVRPFLLGEALGLQVEHGPIASLERHQLVVGAELGDPTVLEDADAVGAPHGREAVRDEDRGALPRRVEQDLWRVAHGLFRSGHEVTIANFMWLARATAQRGKASPYNLRHPLIVRIGNDTQQVLDAFAPDRCNDPKLCQVSTDGVDH